MVSSFDRWLAQPATHSLLRVLTNETAPSRRACTIPCRRRPQSRGQATWTLPWHDEVHPPANELKWSESCRKKEASGSDVAVGNQKSISKARLDDTNGHKSVKLEMSGDMLADIQRLSRQNAIGEHALLEKPNELQSRLEALLVHWAQGNTSAIHKAWRLMATNPSMLTPDNPTVERVWRVCVAAALHDIHSHARYGLLMDILGTAQEVMRLQGCRYVHLHQDLVGETVLDFQLTHQTAEQLACRIQKRMMSLGLVRSEDLLILLEHVLRCSSPDAAFQRFKSVYSLQRSDVLDEHCLQLVKQFSHDPNISKWQPFFHSERRHTLPEDSFMVGGNAALDASDMTARSNAPTKEEVFTLTRQNMSLLVGNVHGIHEKRFSDQFCAKVLATRFFSLDACMKLLHLLGATEVGSVTLLELARRVKSPAEIITRLNQFKRARISVKKSVFARLLKHIGSSNDNVMLQHLLASDQHPDEYDKRGLQSQLLRRATDKKDWLTMELSLTALALNGRQMEMPYYDTLLRHHANEADLDSCVRVFEALRAKSVRLDETTVDFICKKLLPTRARSRAPDTTARAPGRTVHDATWFAIMTCTYAAEGGAGIHPRLFIELLKRCGMTHQTTSLQRLVLWLAKFYSERTIAAKPDRLAYKVRLDGKPPLDVIFNTNMLKAIVVWHWNAGLLHQQSSKAQGEVVKTNSESADLSEALTKRYPWYQGVHLLRSLQKYGYHVDEAIVHEAVVDQLWKLFGPGRSSRRINNLLQFKNNLTLQQYITDANKVWPGLLNDVYSKAVDGTPMHTFFARHHASWQVSSPVIAGRAPLRITEPSRRSGLPSETVTR